MNYRHAYHAGNFADVMKHMALLLSLHHLRQKDAPFCVLDAHGGIGLYNLSSEEALKTGEADKGIRNLDWGAIRTAGESVSADGSLYQAVLKDDLSHGFYTGSPLITARLLRPQDRLVANELHPEDVKQLRSTLRPFSSNVRVTSSDAYEFLRANLPPKERRSLVLIDPPFEKKDEFETLAKQIREWNKRFAQGIYIIWYPIKSHLGVNALKKAASEAGFHRTWCLETLLHPRTQEETLNGCGIMIFNTPFRLPERLMALMKICAPSLSLHAVESSWLTTEA